MVSLSDDELAAIAARAKLTVVEGSLKSGHRAP
jgi:hypothetical protein